MPVLDVAQLLQPIAEDEPAGPNLEYDAAFIELESCVQEKPEQEFGDTIVPGEEVDWREVRKLSSDLLTRTRDIRVVVYLGRALLKTVGLQGFCESITLLRGLLEQQWDALHPQLDPDDDNDPTMRINAVVALIDEATVLRPLREAPIVQARALGAFSLRDYLIATGSMPPPANADGEAPTLTMIEAAFLDADLDELQGTVDALRAGMDDAVAIEACLTDKLGAANAPSLDKLTEVMREILQPLAEQLSRRVAGRPEAAEMPSAGDAPNSSPVASGAVGEIASRQDVVKTLERICDFYRRHEPSSPVPLLLRRASRLVPMDFMQVMRELAPDGVPQVELISGTTEIAEEE